MSAGGRKVFGWGVGFAALLSGCDVSTASSRQGAADDGGGAGGSAAAATAGTAGLGTAGARAADIPIGETSELAMSGGRVTSTELGIRGVVRVVADSHSAIHTTSNLTPPVEASVDRACITGNTARVDQASEICVNKTFTPPATDCWGEFLGVSVELSLNQPTTATGEASGKELSFDASALQGFAFDLDGALVPRPVSLRFSVATSSGVFCNVPSMKLHAGSNALLFSQLVDRCFRITDDPPNPTAESVQSELVKLSWQVITNETSEVPFEFCISNVRAILK